MKTLFNDGWVFSEYELDPNSNYNDKEPILFTPDQFYDNSKTQTYKPVNIPHDWMIYHVKDLYKNSVVFIKKHLNFHKKKWKDIMPFVLKEYI